VKNFSILAMLQEVLKDADLKPMDKNVFSALITFNGKGKMYPSRNGICERLAIKRIPTISESIKRLENKGYIKTFRQKGKNNVYYFSDKNPVISIPAKPEPTKPKEPKQREVKPLTKEQKESSILLSVVTIYAGMFKRKYESGDFALIQKLLKLKEKDNYCYSVKCLMLLYVVTSIKDKINEPKFQGILFNRYKEATKDVLKNVFKRPELNDIPNSNNDTVIPFLKRKLQTN